MVSIVPEFQEQFLISLKRHLSMASSCKRKKKEKKKARMLDDFDPGAEMK